MTRFISKKIILTPTIKIWVYRIIYIFTEITEENKNEFDLLLNDNIKLKANEDILDTFNHLMKADVLILKKSKIFLKSRGKIKNL